MPSKLATSDHTSDQELRWGTIYTAYCHLPSKHQSRIARRYHEIRDRIGHENSAEAMEMAMEEAGFWRGKVILCNILCKMDHGLEYDEIIAAQEAYSSIEER